MVTLQPWNENCDTRGTTQTDAYPSSKYWVYSLFKLLISHSTQWQTIYKAIIMLNAKVIYWKQACRQNIWQGWKENVINYILVNFEGWVTNVNMLLISEKIIQAKQHPRSSITHMLAGITVFGGYTHSTNMSSTLKYKLRIYFMFGSCLRIDVFFF